MTTFRKLRMIAAALAAFGTVESFSPSTVVARQKRSSASAGTSALHFSNAVLVHDENDESSYRYILSKARECAFSDRSTSSDAKGFLKDILELESGCVSGNLAGHDICDNVDELAELVAHLRQKVANNTVLTSNDRDAASTMATLIAVSAVFAVVGEVLRPDNVTPFTVQEWVWAAQGGYLDDMVQHFIRNGGL